MGEKFTRRAFVLMASTAVAFAFTSDANSGLFKRRDRTVATTSDGKPKSKATTVTEVLQDEREAAPMLALLSPEHMQRAIYRYERIAAMGDWPQIEPSKAFLKGGRGESIILLKRRLAMEGYMLDEGAFDDVYDG